MAIAFGVYKHLPGLKVDGRPRSESTRTQTKVEPTTRPIEQTVRNKPFQLGEATRSALDPMIERPQDRIAQKLD